MQINLSITLDFFGKRRKLCMILSQGGTAPTPPKEKLSRKKEVKVELNTPYGLS